MLLFFIRNATWHIQKSISWEYEMTKKISRLIPFALLLVFFAGVIWLYQSMAFSNAVRKLDQEVMRFHCDLGKTFVKQSFTLIDYHNDLAPRRLQSLQTQKWNINGSWCYRNQSDAFLRKAKRMLQKEIIRIHFPTDEGRVHGKIIRATREKTIYPVLESMTRHLDTIYYLSLGLTSPASTEYPKSYEEIELKKKEFKKLQKECLAFIAKVQKALKPLHPIRDKEKKRAYYQKMKGGKVSPRNLKVVSIFQQHLAYELKGEGSAPPPSFRTKLLLIIKLQPPK